MAIDKEDYVRQVAANVEQANVKSSTNFQSQLLKRESVKSTVLVGTPEWDSYLGYLQAIINDLEELKSEAIDMLGNPKVIDHDSLIRAKMVLGEARSSLDILNQVIKLPYAIIHEEASVSKITSKIPLPEIPETLRDQTHKNAWSR